MTAPRYRAADRCNVFIRQWQLVLALRRGPKTLAELARLLDCCQRTVRRDLYALQAVPLPITSRFAAGEGPDWREDRTHGMANVWGIGAMPEWSRSEELPLKQLEVRR